MKTLIALIALALPLICHTQWSSQPWNPIMVDDDFNHCVNPRIHINDDGSTVILWARRDGNSNYYAVRMQKLNPGGYPQWGENGIEVCGGTCADPDPEFAPLDDGSFVVVWHDRPQNDFDIIAQRVGVNGDLVWGNAVAIATSDDSEMNPVIASTGTNHVVIAWDKPLGNDAGVYVQRLDENGNGSWGVEGLYIGESGGLKPRVVTDGLDGGIICWEAANDIVCERILGNGTLDWMSDTISEVDALQENLEMVPDGAGGAILAWEDWRNQVPLNPGSDVYAQRVDDEGAEQWTAGGVEIANTAYDDYNIAIVPDGSAGAFLAWSDEQPNFTTHVKLQHLNASGTPTWTTNGIDPTFGFTAGQYPTLAVDGAELLVIWGSNNGNVMAQRLDGAGNLLWGDDGVFAAVNVGSWFPVIVPSPDGGAIFAWQGGGFNSGGIIYANKLDDGGALLSVDWGFFKGRLQGESVVLEWETLGEYEHSHFVVERRSGDEAFIGIGEVNSEEGIQGAFNNKHYAFVDHNPRSGPNHYRLRQFDIDGKWELSGIVEVRYSPVFSEPMKAYPNPTSQFVTVEGFIDDEKIAISDMAGRLVLSLGAAGRGNTADLSILDPGMYVISGTTSGRSVKVVLVRE